MQDLERSIRVLGFRGLGSWGVGLGLRHAGVCRILRFAMSGFGIWGKGLSELMTLCVAYKPQTPQPIYRALHPTP